MRSVLVHFPKKLWARVSSEVQKKVKGEEGNYFTEMCSGSEAGSYSGLIDFVYPSTPGSRVIKRKERRRSGFNRDT